MDLGVEGRKIKDLGRIRDVRNLDKSQQEVEEDDVVLIDRKEPFPT